MDNDGKLLHQWNEPDGLRIGGGSYLSEEGTLLRSVTFDTEGELFDDPSIGGNAIREFNKEGECIWEFRYYTSFFRLNRDFVILPNGNIIANAWEVHPWFNAKINGFTETGFSDPNGYWSHTLVEVSRHDGRKNPEWSHTHEVRDGNFTNTCKTFSDEADLLWKWDSFDHSSDEISEKTWDINKTFVLNSVDILPSRDHLIFMCEECGEAFVIDHGVSCYRVGGPDGDFIYRWGNPANYGKVGK